MDIDWDLLVRYLAGACNEEERLRLERWLAESPNHRAVMDGAREMVLQARREVPARRAAELLASLRRDVAAADSSPARPAALRVLRGGADRPVLAFPPSARRLRLRWAVGVKAAAAMLVAVTAGALWTMMSRARPIQEISVAAGVREIVAVRGQQVALRLPDGSAVTLAPGSRLRVPETYGTRDRAVALSGEGVFTVVHDARRPFAVRTAHGVAKDLGTRFVVRAYDGDALTQVIVAEGEVELRGRGAGSAGASLLPGQLGQVGASGDVVRRSNVDLDRYFGWAEGRLVFRDTPLREAAAQLARWYDVEIRLADGIADRPLTASAKDDPPGDVLRMVAASLDLELEVADGGRVYTLRAR